MKKISLLAAVALIMFLQSCNIVMHDTIKGNGNMITENRSISSTTRIKSHGSFDVEVVIGNEPALKITADENLLPYITLSNEDGALVIKTKDDVDLSSDNKLKVTVTVSTLEELELYGNGNGTCASQITGGSQLKLAIYGNGDVNFNVNTPRVESTIAGNGNVTLTGQTKDTKIEIDGNGDYKAENLQAENAEVHIAGSGSAHLSCSASLDVHIAGSGDIYYKGSPNITQQIMGSGSLHQIQ